MPNMSVVPNKSEILTNYLTSQAENRDRTSVTLNTVRKLSRLPDKKLKISAKRRKSSSGEPSPSERGSLSDDSMAKLAQAQLRDDAII